jgi:hypothetical protein
MMYAFPTEAGTLLLVEADSSEEGYEVLTCAGYRPHPLVGKTAEAFGTVMVIKPIGGSDVFVAEAR